MPYEMKKADPLAGFSYHKQDQPIKQKLVNKNLAIHIANHASLYSGFLIKKDIYVKFKHQKGFIDSIIPI